MAKKLDGRTTRFLNMLGNAVCISKCVSKQFFLFVCVELGNFIYKFLNRVKYKFSMEPIEKRYSGAVLRHRYRNLLFQILCEKLSQPVERNVVLVAAVVEVCVAGSWDNHQFLVVARQTLEGILPEIA